MSAAVLSVQHTPILSPKNRGRLMSQETIPDFKLSSPCKHHHTVAANNYTNKSQLRQTVEKLHKPDSFATSASTVVCEDAKNQSASWEVLSHRDIPPPDSLGTSLCDWTILSAPLSISIPLPKENEENDSSSDSRILSCVPSILGLEINQVQDSIRSVRMEQAIIMSEPLSESGMLKENLNMMDCRTECTTLALYNPKPIIPFVNSPSSTSAVPTNSHDVQPLPYFGPLNIDSPPSSSSSQPWKGLYNLGNTCYLNSALQMLMSLDGFINHLIEDYNMMTGNPLNDSDGTKSSKLLVELARCFLSLRGQLQNQTPAENSTSSFHCSGDIPEAVDPSHLKNLIDELTPFFIGYQQQDAHEFLSTLLDLLHEELKPIETKQDDSSPISNENCSKESVTDMIVDCRSTPNETNDCQNMICDDSATFVLVNPLDEEQVHPSSVVSENSAKKARVQLSPLCHAECEPFSLEESSVGSLKRASSLSELNMESIENLLHREDATILCASTSSCKQRRVRSWKSSLWKSSSSLNGYLAGGRSIVSVHPTHLSTYSSDSEHGDHTWQVLGREMNDSEPVNNLLSVALLSPSTGPSSGNESEHHMKEISLPQMTITSASDTLVDKYFTTEMRSRITCDSCQYTRTNMETFRYLSLDVCCNEESDTKSDMISNSKYDQSIQEGLRKFFAPEKREIKCEKCFYEYATRTIEITKLPRALILHLKRFIVDLNSGYNNVSIRKNRSPIEFSKHLSLQCRDENSVLADYLASDFRAPSVSKVTAYMDHDIEWFDHDMNEGIETSTTVEKSSQYTLRSLVNHMGSSADCGHYTAYVNTCNGNAEKAWYHFNDSSVSQILEKDAIGESSRKTAYIVLYEFE